MRTILAALVVMLFASEGFAASFDCQKASTSIEHAICMDKTLSELDGELGMLYSEALKGAGDQKLLRSEQRYWISAVRDKCGDTDCLTLAYRDRIAVLTGVDEPQPLSDAEIEQWEQHAKQGHSDSEHGEENDVVTSSVREEPRVESSVQPAPPEIIEDPSKVVADGTSEVSEGSTASSAPASTKVNKLIEDPKQLLKIILVAVLGSLVVLAILGASDRVVVFYNYTDAWWSISPLVFLMGSALIAKFLAPPGSAEFGATDTEKAALAVGAFGALIGVAFTMVNAVRYNKSILVGLPVGVGKIMISALMAVTFVGSFRAMFDSRRTARQTIGFALIVTLVGFLWKMLVNGERVYRRKGWSR